MGLDNGIIIRKVNPLLIPEEHLVEWLEPGEICYWRKCYGLRRDIFNILDTNGLLPQDCDFEFHIDYNSLVDIIGLLKSYNSETWSDSIWSWEQIKERIQQYIRNLEWLLIFYKNHPEIEIIFYDSY